jgi:hypothetical protein
VSKCSRVRTTIATYASGAAANTARSARSSCRMCSGRSPASVGRTKTGCKIPACPLTDRLQFDILQRGPGWRETNAIRSIETAHIHHASRRRGSRVAARGARAAGGDAGIGFLAISSRDTYGYLVDAFRQGLSESGYVEGRNVGLCWFWLALGRSDLYKSFPLPADVAGYRR